MKAAYRALLPLYPKMVHITCLAHGLSRVAEQVRIEYPAVNEWIELVKRVFVKAPARVHFFKEENPGVPLPPEPCITRWGTWLEACFYYAEHFEVYQRFIPRLNAEDSEAIKVKHLLMILKFVIF